MAPKSRELELGPGTFYARARTVSSMQGSPTFLAFAWIGGADIMQADLWRETFDLEPK